MMLVRRKHSQMTSAVEDSSRWRGRLGAINEASVFSMSDEPHQTYTESVGGGPKIPFSALR